jgi:16S rRNA processing protein RimM
MGQAHRLTTELNEHAPKSAPARLRVGRIAGAHGLGGALRVRPDNPDSDTLDNVTRVYLEQDGATREFALLDARRINRTTVRIVLGGVDGPERAEQLRGAALMVAVADLPPAGPGEFYYYQLIGCEVVTTLGRRLGTVEEVFSGGANDVLVVRDGGAEILVPVIENVVKAIDLEGRKVTVEAVPGLID